MNWEIGKESKERIRMHMQMSILAFCKRPSVTEYFQAATSSNHTRD